MTDNSKRAATAIGYMVALSIVVFILPIYWFGFFWFPSSILLFMSGYLVFLVIKICHLVLTEYLDERERNQ